MQITQPEALTDVVDLLVTKIAKHSVDEAAVVALHGDLGAGKTTFMQYFATKLGIHEKVTSPTFVIMKQYALPDTHILSPFSYVCHIDAYRIEDIDEIKVLGFETLLQQKDTIICIEWAEKIEALLPKNTIHVTFTIVGEERTITIT